MAKVVMPFGPLDARYALVYDDEGDGSVSRFERGDVELFLSRMALDQRGWVPGHAAWVVNSNKVRLLESWFGHNDFDRDELHLILHALEVDNGI